MARAKGRLLLLCAAGGMELSWLFAAAALFFSFAGLSYIPFLEALAAFFLAAAVTRFLRGRGWRMLFVLLIHLAGLGGFILLVLYRSWDPVGPLYPAYRVAEFFSRSYTFQEITALLLLFLWTAGFWISGILLGRREHSFYAVTARFDLGIAAFVMLFVIAGLAARPISAAIPLISSFFLFSIFAIALARGDDHTRKQYLSGYRGFGLLLTFSAGLLLLGGAGVMLFLPYLTAAAEAGQVLLAQAGRPLLHLLAHVLLFLFGYGSRSTFQDRGGSPGNGTGDPALLPAEEGSRWGQLLETLLAWGLMGLLAVAALLLAGWCLWHLLHWLLQKTPAARQPAYLWANLYTWLERWRLTWLRLLQKFRDLRGPSGPARDHAEKLFQGLLTWGRTCGCLRRPFETPREYGLYLGRQFPNLREEIRAITDSFEFSIYGGKTLDDTELTRADRAWKKLRSPAQWPRRLRLRLAGDRSINRKE